MPTSPFTPVTGGVTVGSIATIFTPGVRAKLDEQAARIPQGKTGSLFGGVTFDGVEVGIAERWKTLSVEGYLTRTWAGAAGGGVRVSIAW